MNPLILLGAIPSALAVGALAWLLHGWDVGRIEANQAKAITEQATALQEQCDQSKHITEAASAKYESDLNALNADLAKRLQQRAACIPVQSATVSSRSHAAASKPRLPDASGLRYGWLLDFAGDAEKDRLKVIGLQGFIRDTYKANGQ